MPIQYASQLDEHHRARRAGMFDVPNGAVDLHGARTRIPAAPAANDVAKLKTRARRCIPAC